MSCNCIIFRRFVILAIILIPVILIVIVTSLLVSSWGTVVSATIVSVVFAHFGINQGFQDTGNLNRIFLSSHLNEKTLTTTPQIQADDSNLCALYAICFLYFKTLGCGNLCDFCTLFTSDLEENCKIITQIFENVKQINKK